MEPFTTLTSIPTPFSQDNVDTDLIIPAIYLKTVSRFGLGEGAFYSLRFDDAGRPSRDSYFDRPPYRDSEILIAGKNFGCGSSREHAVWALRDLGYRCIIAESFADIFASNCAKNGVLTIALSAKALHRLARDGEAAQDITVDLEAQTITRANGEQLDFAIEDFRKRRLREGLDEVALTLERHATAIEAFEERRRARPWLQFR